MTDDLFDAVLNLEEDYYHIGRLEGIQAGRSAGRLEGRAFGIEKGFEKYLSLGLIKGRTKVWSSRATPTPISNTADVDTFTPISTLPINNPRHIKHLALLQKLTSNPPIRNEQDDVEEVDDRIRRGKAKVKILENALGEDAGEGDFSSTDSTNRAAMETEVEDFRTNGRLLGTTR